MSLPPGRPPRAHRMNDPTDPRPQVDAPLGSPVDAAPARVPERSAIPGRCVSLEPLDPGTHGASLFRHTAGPGNDALWTYMHDGPFHDRATFDRYLSARAASADPLLFAVVDAAGEAQGLAAYMRIDTRNRVIEVGNILYGRALQRTRAATEAMYLMARRAFDDCGYRRYEWKCHALNAPSRAAALRLGFTFEGIFRQHMIVKGRNRDTAWYAMLDTDWPSRRARFERWLDPGNFDDRGRQRTSLSGARPTTAP